MSTAIDTITVQLVHSPSGILAEVENLPPQLGPVWVRDQRLVEAATEAVQQKHPQLLVTEYWVETESRVVLRVESV